MLKKLLLVSLSLFVFAIPIYADNIVQIGSSKDVTCSSVKKTQTIHRKSFKTHSAKVLKKSVRAKKFTTVYCKPVYNTFNINQTQNTSVVKDKTDEKDSAITLNIVNESVNPSLLSKNDISTCNIKEPELVSTKKESCLEVKSGISLLSNTTTKTNHDSNTKSTIRDTGFFIGGDLTLSRLPNIDFGVGVVYDINRNNLNIPVYAFTKIYLNQKFSLLGSLGYNFYTMKNKPSNVKFENGMYYAAGLEMAVIPQIALFTEYNVRNINKKTEKCHKIIVEDITTSKVIAGVKFEI